jgi:carbonic anhydrase
MTPAVAKAGPQDGLSWPDYLTRLEQANVANSLDNLKTFPRLRKLIERGQVATHGAYFGVATGQLLVRDENTGAFVQIAAGDQARLYAPPHP